MDGFFNGPRAPTACRARQCPGLGSTRSHLRLPRKPHSTHWISLVPGYFRLHQSPSTPAPGGPDTPVNGGGFQQAQGSSGWLAKPRQAGHGQCLGLGSTRSHLRLPCKPHPTHWISLVPGYFRLRQSPSTPVPGSPDTPANGWGFQQAQGPSGWLAKPR